VAINFWVGGSFFAIVVLSLAIKQGETHQQLQIWRLVLKWFFLWARLAVALVLGTGVWMFQNTDSGITYAPLTAILRINFQLKSPPSRPHFSQNSCFALLHVSLPALCLFHYLAGRTQPTERLQQQPPW
jgi:nitrate reductase NapE component